MLHEELFVAPLAALPTLVVDGEGVTSTPFVVVDTEGVLALVAATIDRREAAGEAFTASRSTSSLPLHRR